jgi:MOSC domain-containing protein YiiM
MNPNNSQEPAQTSREGAEIVAVCLSSGGIPKRRVPHAEVTTDGLAGDGHNHEIHRRTHRAVLLQDIELLEDLKSEGFPVECGTLGENLTVRGLHVQSLAPGARLRLEDGPLLELTEVRTPCFVLDAIHPDLQAALVGRGGFLARVVEPGRVFPQQRIHIES